MAAGFPDGSDSKESSCSAADLGLIPGLGMIPWRRAWQPTPVFLPGEFHGRRSLVSYSPWGGEESDTTERLKHNNNNIPTIIFLMFWLLFAELICVRDYVLFIFAVSNSAIRRGRVESMMEN